MLPKNNSNDCDCILFLDMNHDRSDADKYVIIDSQLDIKPSINSSQVQVQVHNGEHDGDCFDCYDVHDRDNVQIGLWTAPYWVLLLTCSKIYIFYIRHIIYVVSETTKTISLKQEL